MTVGAQGGHWMVALTGAGRDYPPTDDAGLLQFARGLRSPPLHETIKEAEPESPIHGFRSTDNRRRHFERLRRYGPARPRQMAPTRRPPSRGPGAFRPPCRVGPSSRPRS